MNTTSGTVVKRGRGRPPSGRTTQIVRVDGEAVSKLRAVAAKRGVTLGAMIVKYIGKKLDRDFLALGGK